MAFANCHMNDSEIIRSTIKKITAAVLCVTLLATTAPAGGFADNADAAASNYIPYFDMYRAKYGKADSSAGSTETEPAAGTAEAFIESFGSDSTETSALSGSSDNSLGVFSENGNSETGYPAEINAAGAGIFSMSTELKSSLKQIYLNLYLFGNNVFYEMGRDFFTDYLDSDGNLLSEFDGIWYTLNGYTAPFYVTQMMVSPEGKIVKMGTIPVIWNGYYADLIVYDEDYKPQISGVRLRNSDTIVTLDQLGQQDCFIMVAGYSDLDGTWTEDYQVSPQIYPSEGLKLKYDYLPNKSNVIAYYMIVEEDGTEHTTDALK